MSQTFFTDGAKTRFNPTRDPRRGPLIFLYGPGAPSDVILPGMKQFIALALLVTVPAAALGQDKVQEKAQGKSRSTVRSFLDANSISMKGELEQLFRRHQFLSAASKEAVKADAALKRLNDVVAKKSDAEAGAGLAKAPLAKTARGLTAMAAAAVLKENRTAALAALLLAVEKEPGDVDARVN